MHFQNTALPKSSAGPNVPSQRYFRVAEIAAIFNVHRATVYREIKAGRLDAVRIGGTMRIPAASLAKYEASIPAIVTESAELTVDTLFGDVDLVALKRSLAGERVNLTRAEVAILALLKSASSAPAMLAGVA